MDDFSQAYRKIPVLAAKYLSREVFLGVEPDFVFTTGARTELLKLGINS
jgi:iron complex transport system substrate-binding protein